MMAAFTVILVITLVCLRSFDKAFELLKSTAIHAGSQDFSLRDSKDDKSSSGSSEPKQSCKFIVTGKQKNILCVYASLFRELKR